MWTTDLHFKEFMEKNMRATVKGNFSQTFSVSSTIEELNLIDLLLNWRKDLSSCDYLYANLYLDFFKNH